MKDLDAGFAEVERRVKTLIAENARLRKQVAELERELAFAQTASGELRNFQGIRMQIREKIEIVLQSLEALGEKGTADRADVHASTAHER
ncbi:MAG: hypothetical protein A2010_16225 [Nitrospirae bacterium GWD2_57_9]|nr:MAG: hypothetical protein A2010_16225 [Nitrospirae bacterium GWD2_57_9]OGW49869.1 MAG: hypothetical protein A2078_00855 [Nitrospirae bacterium GWC2_57_9]